MKKPVWLLLLLVLGLSGPVPLLAQYRTYPSMGGWTSPVSPTSPNPGGILPGNGVQPYDLDPNADLVYSPPLSQAAAAYLLQRALGGDTRARARLEGAARMNDPVGQNAFGLYFLNTGDARDAYLWIQAAATQGYAEAQKNLGLLWDLGLGVGPNPVTAVQWFQLAAENGNAEAQDLLGQAYFAGYGVPQDETAALAWFRQAAAQGYAEAARHYALISTLFGIPRQDNAPTPQPTMTPALPVRSY